MKNKKTIKNIIIGLVVAILLLGVYAVITSGAENQGGSSGSSSLTSLIGSGNLGQVQESNTDLANAEILRILGSIQNIDLDDDIFNNPVFRELEDSRFTIPKPVLIGRPNPFLPIGFDALVQTQTGGTQELEVGGTIVEDTGLQQDGNDPTGFFAQ